MKKAGWITIGVVLFIGFLTGGVASSQNSEVEDQPALEATYYDATTVPFFVGRTAESSVVLMRDRFDEQFSDIKNLDTEKDMSTYYRDNGDLNDLDGLFVCSQSMAPGANVPDYAFMNIDIEVSSNCANKEVTFAMGPAAVELGRFVPVSIAGACDRTDYCDLPEMDGIVVGFAEEGFRSHKTVLVQTGLGVMEVELALIDLMDEWCESDDAESVTIREKAIEERNLLLPIGSYVRLVLTKGLYGNERFVHRLSNDGLLTDGEIPNYSVNEMLVSSGYWLPDSDAGSHAWKSIYSTDSGIKDATWQPSTYNSEDAAFVAYQKRILRAANLEFADPNPILATCLVEKEKEIVALYKEEEDDRRRSAAAAKKRASDIEAVWRSVFCSDGGAADYPERCKSYNPAVDDKVGAGSGGGSNCTWVNAHTRNGSSVRGHWRCG